MENTEKNMHKYGLIGKDISYSFSQGYFTKKFKSRGLALHTYQNFDLQSIDEFEVILKNPLHIKGMNVTIPYKQAIIPFLYKIDAEAQAIGAVNTLKPCKDGFIGYNTDAYGFKHALLPHLQPWHKNALILGTGGASKAVAFVLKSLDITYHFVSRNARNNNLTYNDITKEILEEHTIVINCTPLGTFPNIEDKANIPYQFLGKNHLLFDLIYNPEETAFLSEGKHKGATIINGLKMLELQAEKSWEIWNSK